MSDEHVEGVTCARCHARPVTSVGTTVCDPCFEALLMRPAPAGEDPPAAPAGAPPSRCVRCRREAQVCSECMRALALKWWGAIARHPEAGRSCRLCGEGEAAYCPSHLIEEVVAYRGVLARAGTRIGEPDLTGVASVPLEELARLQARDRELARREQES